MTSRARSLTQPRPFKRNHLSPAPFRARPLVSTQPCQFKHSCSCPISTRPFRARSLVSDPSACLPLPLPVGLFECSHLSPPNCANSSATACPPPSTRSFRARPLVSDPSTCLPLPSGPFESSCLSPLNHAESRPNPPPGPFEPDRSSLTQALVSCFHQALSSPAACPHSTVSSQAQPLVSCLRPFKHGRLSSHNHANSSATARVPPPPCPRARSLTSHPTVSIQAWPLVSDPTVSI